MPKNDFMSPKAVRPDNIVANRLYLQNQSLHRHCSRSRLS